MVPEERNSSLGRPNGAKYHHPDVKVTDQSSQTAQQASAIHVDNIGILQYEERVCLRRRRAVMSRPRLVVPVFLVMALSRKSVAVVQSKKDVFNSLT